MTTNAHALYAISPIDGRYAEKVNDLQIYFSEFALIKYRLFVEIQYFQALVQLPLPQLAEFPSEKLEDLQSAYEQFSLDNAQEIKAIERTTNHDVKAVEYFLKSIFDKLNISEYKEFIHFGLTSQDINNTAFPMMLKHATNKKYKPQLLQLIEDLKNLAQQWSVIPMLARTHGQPASPTTMGKEWMVFVERLQLQFQQLKQLTFQAKFGGATGNFNAHQVAYPDIDWADFGNHFTDEFLGLERQQFTTQIEHYDNLAALFQNYGRINTILIDFCRDVWTYIALEYFKQRTVKDEVGSSAMPHKVNPIDFENAEGNLGIANAFFQHLAEKLPISRLQRDLTDSTVLRNIGVPFAHTIIALQSIQKGLKKLIIHEEQIYADLEKNWIVVAEAIQTILRREKYDQPYEALKELTRGNAKISKTEIHEFIDLLTVTEAIKQELKQITPFNYIGIH
ncbi:MAG: adenylosuccinate lyase [Saprospiraceae bacterium]|nr:adenylosuccinate lyase [Saprospiraceae bacterium]